MNQPNPRMRLGRAALLTMRAPGRSPRGVGRGSRRARLRVETLEDRTTPATFTVLNADDSGAGSLRQAITDANGVATDDTIVFDAGAFATPQTITLLTGLPTFGAGAGPLTITGPGEGLLTVRRSSGAPAFSVFTSQAPTLTLTGMTVSGGNTGGNGGGLDATGTVTLDHVVLTGNRASNVGGGINLGFNSFLTLRNSTITGNTAGNQGGGVRMYHGGLLVEDSTVSNNAAGGGNGGGGLYFIGTASASPPSGFTPSTLVVRNSTVSGNSTTTTSSLGGGGISVVSFTGTLLVQNSDVSGNSAATNGGGISVHYGTVTVRNTTITGNTTGTSGGGIAVVSNSSGPITIQNSTVVGNTASGSAAGTGGGGISRTTSSTGTLTVANSVIAGNTNVNGPDILTAATGTTTNVNFSAIGSAAGFTLSGTSANNIAPGTDLKLLPRAFVGGPTKTMAPAFGSPLIDAGQGPLVPAGLTTDQRGGAFARVAGAAVDIGAVESQAPFVPVAAATAPPVTASGATSYQFTVTFTDPQGPGGAINTAGIVGNNSAVRVTGPTGNNIPVTYVSIDNAANGTPRTATYSITPPGGSWDPLDSGTYTVSVAAGQVADVDGNFVVADTIGTFVAQPAYVVTNADDAGAGSLREAISLANGTANPDAIEFAPAFFNVPRTISLLTPLPTFPAAGGALAITGPGEGLLTVQRDAAAASFRVFTSLAPSLSLIGMTVSGGNVGGNGGGLEATGTVTLDHVVLSGNRATGVGGGVHVAPGFLMVRNSTITGNAAAGSGGGVRLYQGSLFVEDSTVSGNTAAGSNGGGGLYFGGTASASPPPGFTPNTLVVRNSTISGNSTTTSSSLGGGGISVINFNGTLLIQGSTVSGNSAVTNGGGVSVHYGTVTVQNSTVVGNTAGVPGGAISTATGGGIAVVGSTGTVNVRNSTVVGNTAFGTAPGTGGGGLARTTPSAGTITVANSVVAGNTNANGPDILTAATGTTANVNFSAIGSNTGFTLSGTSANNVPPGTDLKLVPLTFVGGPTRAMAPAFGSPLIDAGQVPLVPAGLTTDQRGGAFARVAGAAVDIGAVESQAPFLPVAAATAAPVVAAGGTAYQFTVTFSDPQGPGGAIDTAGVIGNNAAVRVTGPTGNTIPVTFVSIDDPADGPTRTATYSIVPPGGSWDPLDFGTYTVSVLANQVADIDGNFVVAGAVGTFVAQPPYVVTNADSTGAGSLREAITLANGTANPDAIEFAPAFFNVPRTISLLTPLPQVAAGGGALTITGTGEANLTVRRDPGAAAFGVFDSLAPALTLTGMTVSGGSGVAGAGLRASGTVTLDHMTFSGNSGSVGGAMFLNSGTFVSLRNSTLSGNTSGSSAGALYLYSGGLLMENSTVANNTAAGGSGGGGLMLRGTPSATPPVGFTPSTMVVRNSTVSGNTATGPGGGISVPFLGGTLLVQNSTLSGNSATTTGGGISAAYGSVTVQNGTIVGNTATTSGGGIAVTVGSGTTTIQNSTIVGNTANGSTAGTGGGGLARTTTSAGTVTVANSVIAGNTNANGPDILTAATGSTVQINFSAIGSNTGYTPSAISANNIAPGTNLLLGAPADNGGPTRTLAPQPLSPLINAGADALVPAGLTTDQRGGTLDRKFGLVDIGSFEVQPPKVRINQAAGQADPTNGSSIVFAVQFNAPVTGFDPTDVSFTGSTVGGTLVPAVTGSGADYTVTVTGMAGDGNVVASVLANAGVDGSQSGSAASTSSDNSVRVDTTLPTVTINQAGGQADPTNGSPVSFTVHFNEAVTGFTGADVSFVGSTVGGTPVATVTGSGADYAVAVTGMTGDGTVVVGIPAGGAFDLAGNASLASTSLDATVRFDNIRPDVTVTRAVGQSDPTQSSPIAFDVHFSEAVTGFAGADVSFAGSTVGGTLAANVTGSGTDYVVTVTGMTGQGEVVVTVPAESAIDVAGNGNTVSMSADNSVRFDVVAPTVTIEQGSTQPDPATASPITFDVHFSEPITDFTPADVSFAGGTVGGTLVANIAGSGADYTVTVTGMSGVGTVVASIPAGRVADAAGNPNAASTSVDNSVLFDNIGQVNFASAVFNATGEGGVVTVTVTRAGGTDGPASVDLLMTAGSAHFGDDYTPAPHTFAWADGESGSLSFDIAIPDDSLNEGRETFSLKLVVSPGSQAPLGLSDAQAVIGPNDGLVITATAAKPSGVITDDLLLAGDLVTVALGGKVGTATVYLTDPDGDGRGPIELIELAGTDPAKSTLTITTKRPPNGTGDLRVSVGEITGTGLKSLTATKADLNGAGIHLNGYLGTLAIGNVSNGADISTTTAAPPLPTSATKITAGVIGDGTAIAVTGVPISTFSAISIGDGAITAPSIGTLSVTGKPKAGLVPAIPGDFKSDVTLTGTGLATGKLALNAMTVAGSVFPGVVINAPSVGSITVKKDMTADLVISGVNVLPGKQALKSLKVTGAITNTTLDVMGNVGSVTAATFVNSNLYVGYNATLGTFPAPYTVDTFKVTGTTGGFAQSFAFATTFKSVSLASVATNNGGTKFGFTADSAIGSLSVANGLFKFNPNNVNPQGIGDFEAKVV
jgi:Bacterial Ig-like domain/Calx-beta domain/Right handed beta helix region